MIALAATMLVQAAPPPPIATVAVVMSDAEFCSTLNEVAAGVIKEVPKQVDATTRLEGTPAELQHLIAQVIAGVAGGSEAAWRRKIGAVTQRPIALHPRSNWSVSPMCGTDDHRLIEQAAAVVRAEHPYVA